MFAIYTSPQTTPVRDVYWVEYAKRELGLLRLKSELVEHALEIDYKKEGEAVLLFPSEVDAWKWLSDRIEPANTPSGTYPGWRENFKIKPYV